MLLNDSIFSSFWLKLLLNKNNRVYCLLTNNQEKINVKFNKQVQYSNYYYYYYVLMQWNGIEREENYYY